MNISYLEASNIRHCKFLLKNIGNQLEKFLYSEDSCFTNYYDEFIKENRRFHIFMCSGDFVFEGSGFSVSDIVPILNLCVVIDPSKNKYVTLKNFSLKEEVLSPGNIFSINDYSKIFHNIIIEKAIKHNFQFIIGNEIESPFDFFKRINSKKKRIITPYYSLTENKFHIKESEIKDLANFTKYGNRMKEI